MPTKHSLVIETRRESGGKRTIWYMSSAAPLTLGGVIRAFKHRTELLGRGRTAEHGVKEADGVTPARRQPDKEEPIDSAYRRRYERVYVGVVGQSIRAPETAEHFCRTTIASGHVHEARSRITHEARRGRSCARYWN